MNETRVIKMEGDINPKFQDAKFEEIYARIIAENKFKATIAASEFDRARIAAQHAIQRKGIEAEDLRAALAAANARVRELETVVRANNGLLLVLHANGAVRPDYVITRSDLFDMQVQLDENAGTLLSENGGGE